MKRRPQYGVRDLLWLSVAAALVCGWYVEHQDNLAAKHQLDIVSARLVVVEGELVQWAHEVYRDASDNLEFPPDEVALNYARQTRLTPFRPVPTPMELQERKGENEK
jgi:hypothetical protein